MVIDKGWSYYTLSGWGCVIDLQVALVHWSMALLEGCWAQCF